MQVSRTTIISDIVQLILCSFLISFKFLALKLIPYVPFISFLHLNSVYKINGEVKVLKFLKKIWFGGEAKYFGIEERGFPVLNVLRDIRRPTSCRT